MAGNGSSIIHDGEDVVFSYRHGGVKHPDGRPPRMTPASPALVRSNTTTTGGQRDGRKQEVEAQDHACCVGGGNLTLTFLTNPPVNKDLLPCSAGLCCDPPRPTQNLLFTISSLLLQRRKWAWRVRETPRGQRGRKAAGFVFLSI